MNILKTICSWKTKRYCKKYVWKTISISI